MKTNRRSFLKLAAAGAAGAAIGGAALGRGKGRRAGAGYRWEKAPCALCGAGCGVQVGVDKDRVVAVAGDTEAAVNKGMLCVKGYHAGAALYGVDRLTAPLLRRDGVLRPITWDLAVRLIADRVARGPAGFAIHGSGLWTIGEAYLAQKLMKAGLVSNQVSTSTRFSDAAVLSAMRATYGDEGQVACCEDLDAATVVISWATNAAEEQPVLFSRVTDRRIGGEEVTLVDVGGRRTRTTSAAQSFVRCRPGTEPVVLKGILRLLLATGTWDHDFVEEHASFWLGDGAVGRSVSIEEWKAALDPYTPDAVQRRSEVRAADLRMLAGHYGRREARITSLWSEGLSRGAHGEATNRLLHAVHLLSGHVGRPGDGPMVMTAQASTCGSAWEVGASPVGLPGGLRLDDAEERALAERLWQLPAGRLSATPGHEPTALWERFSTTGEDGGDVHTVWVQASNPAQTLPDGRQLFDRSRKDPDKLLIVSEVYPTPTTRTADLVLPSTMWVEKNGMSGNLDRRTQQWFKMVSPPGDARDDSWQLIAVARELHQRGFAGLLDAQGRFMFDFAPGTPIWDWKRYGGVNVDRLVFEEYRRFADARGRGLARYDEYTRRRGLRWPVTQAPDGQVGEAERRFAARAVSFPQSSGGDRRARAWLPADVAPESPADRDYPFQLATVDVVEHSGSGTLTGRIPELRGAMPSGYLELNREDANRLGIVDGETVSVESRTGSLQLPVWVEGRGSPMPGTAVTPLFDDRLRPMVLVSAGEGTAAPGPCAVRIRRLTG